MVNFTRRSKDPYSWSYHNDLIAAVGRELEYHVSLGLGAKFYDFAREFYKASSPPFIPIYFISAAETDERIPAIGVMTSEYSILRLLEHPLAKEFREFIPWAFHETFYAMQTLLEQMPLSKTLPEIYKTIEDLRWVNHKVVRRSILEDIIQQLNSITVGEWWEAMPAEKAINYWISDVSDHILLLKSGKEYALRLPLPHNENFTIPTVMFWLQLLNAVLKNQYKYWKVYWTNHSLLFMNGPHLPSEVVELVMPLPEETLQFEPFMRLPLKPEMTLMELLSCWTGVLKLQ